MTTLSRRAHDTITRALDRAYGDSGNMIRVIRFLSRRYPEASLDLFMAQVSNLRQSEIADAFLAGRCPVFRACAI